MSLAKSFVLFFTIVLLIQATSSRPWYGGGGGFGGFGGFGGYGGYGGFGGYRGFGGYPVAVGRFGFGGYGFGFPPPQPPFFG